MNLFLDPVGKEQAPVTSEGMNKTIERYLAEYARKHLGKPLTSAPNSNFPDFFYCAIVRMTKHLLDETGCLLMAIKH